MVGPKAAGRALSSCPGDIGGHGRRVSSSPERLTGCPPSGPCDRPLRGPSSALLRAESPQEPEGARAPVPDELLPQHVLRVQRPWCS